jgi:hypothetical protein
MRLSLAIAAIGLSLSFTFGQSDLSAGRALAIRFLGSHEVGSSDIRDRIGEANVALGYGDPATIVVGRGIGAAYYSPISPGAGLTPYVHMGYPWLVLQGGLLLALAVVAILFWAARIYWKAASKANGISAGALAGMTGSVASFTATNAVINRFASVEGAAFIGTMLGSVVLVIISTEKRNVGGQPTAARGGSTK